MWDHHKHICIYPYKSLAHPPSSFFLYINVFSTKCGHPNFQIIITLLVYTMKCIHNPSFMSLSGTQVIKVLSSGNILPQRVHTEVTNKLSCGYLSCPPDSPRHATHRRATQTASRGEGVEVCPARLDRVLRQKTPLCSFRRRLLLTMKRRCGDKCIRGIFHIGLCCTIVLLYIHTYI